jgi:hypothetical protein
MTTLLSTPTTVTVRAPSTTALGVLAASMSPGSWARLTPANDQNAILGVGDISGSMIQYAHNACWNPLNQTIEIVGADHNYGANMRYVRYDAPSNQFVCVNAGALIDSGVGSGHEFCGTAVNPYTGEPYYRHYTGTVGVAQFVVTKAALNGTAFSTALPLSPVSIVNIVAGSCWWSGSLAGVGAQGAFMIYNCGNSAPGGSANDGQILAYDPLAASWLNLKSTGASPWANGSYHEVAAYSSIKNMMVYGGGNGCPTKLWKLSSDGTTITPMPDTPSGAAVGIQWGNLREDPVTGNFLLLSNGQLYELNPDGAGTWTQQTGSRVPPSDVGIPGNGAHTITQGVVSSAIPELGVIAYITQDSGSIGSFYLYKHA